jgi:hypothetical protein
MTEGDGEWAEVERSVDLLLDRWSVAECITADGETSYWLMNPHPHGPPGCACAQCAPHDWLAR